MKHYVKVKIKTKDKSKALLKLNSLGVDIKNIECEDGYTLSEDGVCEIIPPTDNNETIENEVGSANKLFVTEDSIFITDRNNTIIYETKNNSDIDIKNSDMEEENFVIVTINYNELTKKLVVTKNDTLSKYNLDDVKNINGKVFVKFVTGDNKVFSEDTSITDNIELTAVYKENEAPSSNKKDETPKTGTSDYLGFTLVTVAISTLLIIALKRKF